MQILLRLIYVYISFIYLSFVRHHFVEKHCAAANRFLRMHGWMGYLGCISCSVTKYKTNTNIQAYTQTHTVCLPIMPNHIHNGSEHSCYFATAMYSSELHTERRLIWWNQLKYIRLISAVPLKTLKKKTKKTITKL